MADQSSTEAATATGDLAGASRPRKKKAKKKRNRGPYVCSDCGAKGHRAGGVKCPGPKAPAPSDDDEDDEGDEEVGPLPVNAAPGGNGEAAFVNPLATDAAASEDKAKADEAKAEDAQRAKATAEQETKARAQLVGMMSRPMAQLALGAVNVARARRGQQLIPIVDRRGQLLPFSEELGKEGAALAAEAIERWFPDLDIDPFYLRLGMFSFTLFTLAVSDEVDGFEQTAEAPPPAARRAPTPTPPPDRPGRVIEFPSTGAPADATAPTPSA
jgi:hypothetical protein